MLVGAGRLAGVIVIVALAAVWPLGVEAKLSQQQAAAIDKIVKSSIKASGVAAVSVAIAEDRAIVYAHGLGERDKSRHARADQNTVFGIGAITMQFTAAAIQRLAREGKVALDAPIGTYVPNAPHAGEITVRQLLNQLSGLADYLPEARKAGMLYEAFIGPERLVALVADRALAFPPGSKFEFSATNYLLLGMIIEHVTGNPYPMYLRTKLLDPQQLRGIEYARGSSDVANGYIARDPSRTPVRPMAPAVAFSAAALLSTASDLVRWDGALFGGRVLTNAELTAMTTPPSLPAGAQTTYGFGIYRAMVAGKTKYTHGGAVPGSSADNAYFPHRKLSIAVLASAAEFSASALVDKIAAIVDPTLGEAATNPAPIEDPAITARVRGEYFAWRQGKIERVRYSKRANSALSDEIVGKVRQQLSALGELRSISFRSKTAVQGAVVYLYQIACANGNVRMTFSLDKDDKIAGVFFTQE